jgi:hypothetical protein
MMETLVSKKQDLMYEDRMSPTMSDVDGLFFGVCAENNNSGDS